MMKFKSKGKEKSSSRASKAVDEHLEEDILVWAGNSFTSIASSVTAPPSQTASFYKKALNYDDDNFDFSDSEGSSLSDNRTMDDNLSWADNRSRCSSEGGGESAQAVKKPSKKDKKDKKKKTRKGRMRLFGGTIAEDHDAEKEEEPQPARRARRLSLFGNGESNHEGSRYGGADVDVSVHQNDEEGGGLWSNDGNDELEYDDLAPPVSRSKAKRRGSLGGIFSKNKHESKGGEGGRSVDGSHATQSQSGTDDELGYVDCEPTVTRTKAKRRGSLGGMFAKNNPERKGGDGGRSVDGSHATRSHSGDDELGYQDCEPTVTRTKAKRRGSLGGMFSKNKPESKGGEGGRSVDGSHAIESLSGRDDELGYQVSEPTVTRTKAKRRGSLGGMFAKNNPERKGGDGGRSVDGSHMTGSHDSSDGGLEYEDGAPTISRTKPNRRGSVGGMFAKNKHENKGGGGGRSVDESHATRSQDGSGSGEDLGYEEAAPSVSRTDAKRRGSLGGLLSKHNPEPDSSRQRAERKVTRSDRHGTEHANEKSMSTTSNHTAKTQTKSNRRRQSLTGSNYKGNSSQTLPPKELHWIVNQERKARGMPVFVRNGMLDALAKSMCNEMAVGLPPSPTEYYGNVGRGESLPKIHATIMDDRSGISRKNILSEKFTEFGMALTLGHDSQYYMVALFN